MEAWEDKNAMTKLKGPGMATSARGQLASELIFSNWKGTAYLKQHRSPKQPRTRAQLAMRAMMDFLSRSWQYIAPARQATWIQLAAASNVSPFNAYQSYNLTRFRDDLLPSQIYPAAGLLTPSSLQSYTATGIPLAVKHDVHYTFQFSGWGFILYKLPTGAPTYHWYRIAHVLLCLSTGHHKWTQRNLAPGIHRYACRNFSIDGKLGYTSGIQTATVTN